jgi:hypothetical protein
LRVGSKLLDTRGSAVQLDLLLYASVRVPPPPAPVLNVSSYLLEGFEEGLAGSASTIVGAGLIGEYDFRRGVEFCGSTVGEQCAVAASISGDVSVHTRILHGCQPMGDYHTITRIDGPVLYEIDGRPALDVIDELLGDSGWQRRLPLLLVTLGVNHGERYGIYDEENYVNRLIVGIVPDERAIVLFEADFENGTEFQFMRRNAELMLDSAERGCREAVEHLEASGIDPILALYIDCAGRASAFSGGDREEAAIVQDAVGAGAPLFGFYSGVEIAPLLGRSRGLDWTGVLTILGRSR